MTTYFVGGGFDCWQPSLSGISDGATSITLTNGYADALLRDATGARVAVSSLWFHSDISASNYDPGNGNIPFMFRSTTDAAQARFRWEEDSGGTGYVFEYYDGAAWHGTPPVNPGQTFGGTVDAEIVIDAVNGKIAWYFNGVFAAQLTGVNTSGMLPISYIRVSAVEGYAGSSNYANTIIADYNTIGHTMRRRTATGNGPEQGWSGDYTAIDEDVANDATALTTSTSDVVSNFTGTILSATPTGSIIKSVAVGTRLRASGAAPTGVETVLTIGGTDYFGPAMVNNSGFVGVPTMFDVDPSTGVAWASIDAVNGDFGVKAVA